MKVKERKMIDCEMCKSRTNDHRKFPCSECHPISDTRTLFLSEDSEYKYDIVKVKVDSYEGETKKGKEKMNQIRLYAEVLALRAEASAIYARVQGMTTANQQRLHLNQSVMFNEDCFFTAEAELLQTRDKLHAIAADGEYILELLKEGKENDSN
jgi:hypothetical protein